MNKIWTTFFTVLFSNKFFHERCSSERRTSYARCGRIPSQNLVTQPGFNLLLEITGMFAYYVDWTKQFSCKIYPLKTANIFLHQRMLLPVPQKGLANATLLSFVASLQLYFPLTRPVSKYLSCQVEMAVLLISILVHSRTRGFSCSSIERKLK